VPKKYLYKVGELRELFLSEGIRNATKTGS